MPHATLKLLPGLDQNETPVLNEAGISTSNLIRFVPDRNGIGLIQKLGGWGRYYAQPVASIVRALWAWEDTNANKWLGVGIQSATPSDPSSAAILGVLNASTNANGITTGNTFTNITPSVASDDIAVSFSTTSASATVKITDSTNQGINQYDSVYVATQVSVGGIVLFGLYPVIANASSTAYQIQSIDLLGNPLAATGTITNGGAVPTFATTSGSTAVSVTLANHGYSAGSTFSVLVSTSLSQTETITGASWSTSVVTFTFSGSDVIAVGSSFMVSGLSPSGYNGSYAATVSGAGTVSAVLTSNPGVYVSGTSLVANGPSLFGNYIVQSVTSSSVFIITAPSPAPVTLTSVAMNGGNVRLIYSFGSGPQITTTGYGIGGYGKGGYGTGTSVSSGSGSPIGSVDDWTLDNWGEILIASPHNSSVDSVQFQGVYSWQPTSNTPYAQIIPQAPPVNEGIFVAMPQRQIIAYGSTFTGIQDPLLVRWCDVSNYSAWIGTVVNQAGSYRIPKGSRIVGGLQAPQQCLLWTDISLWSMQYVGSPYIYSFNEIASGCGLIAKKAACVMDGTAFWMGQSQFYMLSGNGVEAIACPVWDTVFQELDFANLNKIRACANSRFKEITWYYPIVGGSGENTNYIKFNAYLNQWDFGTLGRSAWINESVLGPPIAADPSSLYIYQHEISPDADGSPILASFSTGYFSIADGDAKVFVDQVWPDMKWGYYGQSQNATITFSINYTDYPGQAAYNTGNYTLTQGTTFISPRIRARLLQLNFSSSDVGTWWRIGGVRYRFAPDGQF